MSETVVVGYDGNEPSKRALDRALQDAKTSGGSLVIAIALQMPFDPTVPETPYEGTVGLAPATDGAEAPAALKPLADEAVARARAAGVEAVTVFGAGDPARTIVDAAKDHNASRIVLGQDHHTWFGRLFGENVEAEVRREAGCDVLVVP